MHLGFLKGYFGPIFIFSLLEKQKLKYELRTNGFTKPNNVQYTMKTHVKPIKTASLVHISEEFILASRRT